MKNLFTLIVVLGLSIQLNAQSRYYSSTNIPWELMRLDLPVKKDSMIEYVKKREISSVQINLQVVKPNGKVKPEKIDQSFLFDPNGRLTHYLEFKKGSTIETRMMDYDSQNNIIGTSVYGKNFNLIHRRFTSYNSEGKVDFSGTVNKNGDTSYFNRYYPKIGNTSSSEYYKNGKLIHRYVSTYYDNGDMQKRTLYKPNGKIKYVWDYECKETGVEVFKHKDTTTVCTSKSIDDDGNTTIVNQMTDEKGEIYKSITVQNAQGKRMSYSYFKVKGGEEKLLYKNEYRYAKDTVLISESYESYEKEKLKHYTQMEYDEVGNLTNQTQRYYKNGELLTEYTTGYIFDGLNRPVQRSRKENNGSAIITQYTYQEQMGSIAP
ncbi:MAG: hypothetical protein H6607_05095 [Flavobacteriales bacterium]|nr:hypothetical protein [Flavobacteriales bacterium]